MATPLIMVPPLTLWNCNGEVDSGATAAYAQRAASTWFDLFMLSGSIGEGKTSTSAARRRTLEVWLEYLPKERLCTCIWSSDDYAYVQDLGVRAVVVLQGFNDSEALLELLAHIPAESFVYSHPDYSSVTLTPAIAASAVQEGVLPTGAKISKISLDDIRAMRTVVGSRFALFDGRCRNIEASIGAGATGVVVVPFCLMSNDLPDRTKISQLQQKINEVQSLIDAQNGTFEQARMLTGLLRSTL
jgi:dihydrodipicolinate synthase/N-acetylneuraminate lyase